MRLRFTHFVQLLDSLHSRHIARGLLTFMINDTVLPAAQLFADKNSSVIPLVTGRDLRLVLKRYRVPTAIFALVADMSEAALESALYCRSLNKGPAFNWYCRMRRFEHRIACAIAADIQQYGQSILPRFLSDRHMAMYSPDDSAMLPSARIAAGISAWVSSHFVDDDGSQVKIYDFNMVRYAQWLEEHDIDHDDATLDFWLTQHQA